MTAYYAPGTVAVATVKGERNVRVTRGAGIFADKWYTNRPVAGSDTSFHGSAVTDVHPLVVLDPADLPGGDLLPEWLRAQARDVERTSVGPLIRALQFIADQIEAQTKPPKPAEPTGLGAVVETAKGTQYVSVNKGPHACWIKSGHGLTNYGWGEFDAVRVLSEGVSS